MERTAHKGLHRYAIAVVVVIVILIFFGGQVKSTNSGLSVPDWPNTYGHFMFSFPWEEMVGGIFWEHAHRMIASVAGLLTFLLTIWVYRVDKRKVVRQVALWASIAVLVQGVMGGLTVLSFLPLWASGTHGTLAQVYFCLVVLVALMTSPGWRDVPERVSDAKGVSLRNLTLITTVVIFIQLMIGAIMRHSESGLVIPDFPTMFGSWIPPFSDERILAANHMLQQNGLLAKARLTEATFGQMFVHVLHRVWAFVVMGLVFWEGAKVLKGFKKTNELRRPVMLLLALVIVQATLGIFTILTEKQFTITTLHVVTGALTLATSLVLTLRARRLLYTSTPVTERVTATVSTEKVLA